MLRWRLRRSTSWICGSREASTLHGRPVSVKVGWPASSEQHHGPDTTRPTTHEAGKLDVPSRIGHAQNLPQGSENAERAVRARHLLRSILRECTYLPDSGARQWTKQYALQRFRRYTFFAWEDQGKNGYEQRIRAKEKEARRWLTYLQGANDGQRRSVRRILLMAYGRVGKRRRELMQPFLVKENVGGVEAPHAASQDSKHENEFEDGFDQDLDDKEDRGVRKHTSTTTAAEELDAQATQRITPHMTGPLRALVLSQVSASPPDLTRTNPRRIDLIMPMFNAWLRPMPQVRVKNALQKHYAELLDRVLPPLPSTEWNRLLALASGSQPLEPPVPRRQPATHSYNTSVHQREKSALDYVVAFGKLPKRLLDKRGRKTLLPRSMRRLYAEVFSQCPRMDWDSKTQQWNITWGGTALQVLHTSKLLRHPPELQTHSSHYMYIHRSKLNAGEG